MKEKSVLVIGDINIDFTLFAKDYPVEGGEANTEGADFRLGGSACITAMSLQILGMPTSLAGSVGADLFADFALGQIQASGLDTSLVQCVPEGQTGFFMILITSGGQRTMFGNRGANNAVPDAGRILERLGEFRHLHLSGYSLMGDAQWETIRHIVLMCSNQGLTTSLDPGVCSAQQARERILELLPQMDVFLPSRTEMLSLFPGLKPDEAIRKALDLGCRSTVLKMGKEGSRYVDSILDVLAPAEVLDRPVVNTTGAGDSFNAGFLAGWLGGKDPAECLRMGSQAAARIITTRNGIIELLNKRTD